MFIVRKEKPKNKILITAPSANDSLATPAKTVVNESGDADSNN